MNKIFRGLIKILILMSGFICYESYGCQTPTGWCNCKEGINGTECAWCVCINSTSASQEGVTPPDPKGPGGGALVYYPHGTLANNHVGTQISEIIGECDLHGLKNAKGQDALLESITPDVGNLSHCNHNVYTYIDAGNKTGRNVMTFWGSNSLLYYCHYDIQYIKCIYKK